MELRGRRRAKKPQSGFFRRHYCNPAAGKCQRGSPRQADTKTESKAFKALAPAFPFSEPGVRPARRRCAERDFKGFRLKSVSEIEAVAADGGVVRPVGPDPSPLGESRGVEVEAAAHDVRPGQSGLGGKN